MSLTGIIGADMKTKADKQASVLNGLTSENNEQQEVRFAQAGSDLTAYVQTCTARQEAFQTKFMEMVEAKRKEIADFSDLIQNNPDEIVNSLKEADQAITDNEANLLSNLSNIQQALEDKYEARATEWGTYSDFEGELTVNFPS